MKEFSKNKYILITALSVLLLIAMPITQAFGAGSLLAFPGAEGGGKYSLGARGESSMSVYHVTNLNDSGTGSFRDAVSKSGRIVVFDVGGTINLNSGISMSKSNITILGQTAPGDGITLTGGSVTLGSGIENVIIRYIRVRPTDKNGGEPDGIGGRWTKNVIMDHCSTSWSVDELLTLYAGSTESRTQGSYNTVQYTLASESLRMSNHFKGAHGYGGIFGATMSTWHHNMLAHHDSRSPRLDRELQGTDVRNNVIYDWGQTNSAYGGEPYSYNNKTQNGCNINWVNNYYKYGPGTGNNIKNRIFDVSNAYPEVKKANFYFDGNFMYGDENVTNNNISGVNNSSNANILSAPYSMGDYEINTQTATDAYDTVINNVGATLPKRDSIDARIIADAQNQTGRIINNANEVAGYVEMPKTTRTFSIPSDWKAENGMGSATETAIVPSGEWAGYTWIEAYVNDWTAQQSIPTNPGIVVTSPSIQSINNTINGVEIDNGQWKVINDNETLAYNAVTIPVDGTTVNKIEIYDGSTLIKTVNADTINENLTLSAGTHYISSRAYNDKGESTQSPTSIVYVKSTLGTGDFTHTQIGTPEFNNLGGAALENNVYTLWGSGMIYGDALSESGTASSGKDSFDFLYKELTGDFEITVKGDQIPKFENGEVCGIMLKESLDQNSRMAFLADGWLKYGENVRAIYKSSQGGKNTVSYFKNSSGSSINNSDTYDTSNDKYRVPSYLHLKRTGDVITFSVSDTESSRTDNPRQPQTVTFSGLPEKLYVGIAADSSQGRPKKGYMAEAKFSSLSISDGTATPKPSPTATPLPTATPTAPPTATWTFSENGFKDLTLFPANTEIDGITVSSDSVIADSAKTFTASTDYPDNSNFSYTKVCKISKSTLSFDVLGSCDLIIDASSANSLQDRAYTVYANNTSIGTYTCLGGKYNSYRLSYTGEATKISIVPNDGINIYGIDLKYQSYSVKPDNDIKNGSISISSENQNSGTVTWKAEDYTTGTEAQTNVFGDTKSVQPINGKDELNGIITFFDAVQWYNITDVDASNHVVLKGLTNPTFVLPFSDTKVPSGNVFMFKPAEDGEMVLDLYVFANKTFILYDNNNESYLVQQTYPSTSINSYTIDAKAGNEYYAWATGSKIGVESVTVGNSTLSATPGEKITITTTPNDGYYTEDVSTSSGTNVTKEFENTYSFIMPAMDVTVNASFSNTEITDPTATPAPTATTVPTATSSPVPTATSSPVPTATNIPDGIFYIQEPKLNTDNTISVSIINNTTDQTGYFAVGIYDSTTENLKGIEYFPISQAEIFTKDIILQTNISSGDVIKVFLWNDKLMPLSKVFQLK